MKYLLPILLFVKSSYAFATQPNDPTNITITTTDLCSDGASFGNSSTLSASCTGSSARWWDSPTASTPIGSGGTFVFSGSSPGVVQLYVSCVISSLESFRVPLNPITVHPRPGEPTMISPTSQLTVCPTRTTKLIAKCDAGSTVTWYEEQNSILFLAESDALGVKVQQNSTYWLSCKNPGCESNRIITPHLQVGPTQPVETTLNTDAICSTTSFNLEATTSFSGTSGDYFWTKNDELMTSSATQTFGAGNGVPSSGVWNDLLLDGTDVYAASNNGIYKSSNGGFVFTQFTTANGLPNNQVLSLAKFNTLLIAGTASGPAFSSDGGTTFFPFSALTGVQNVVVNKIRVDNSNSIYFCTNAGLYISRNNGLDFRHITVANGLPSNSVKDVVYIESKNQYWILTSAQLGITNDNFANFSSVSSLGGVSTINLVDAVANEVGTELYFLNANGAIGYSNDLNVINPTFQIASEAPVLQNPKSLAMLNSGLMAICADNGIFIYKSHKRIKNPLTNTNFAVKVGIKAGEIWGLQQNASMQLTVSKTPYINTKVQALTGLVIPDRITNYIGAPLGTCPQSEIRDSVSVRVGAVPQNPINFIGNSEQCENITFPLVANCPNTTVSMYWYDDVNSQSEIGIGESISSSITANTTFYAECVAPTGCRTARIQGPTITLSVPPTPTNVNVNKTEVCEDESVNFTGNCGFNSFNRWFDSPSGGILVQSGGALNTPVTPSQSQYYLGCVSSAGCQSPTRVATPAVTFKPNADAVNITYNSAISANTIKLAGDFLQAGNMLNAPAAVQFKAGKSLEFIPGFESKTGTVFSALIEAPCVNSSTPANVTY